MCSGGLINSKIEYGCNIWKTWGMSPLKGLSCSTQVTDTLTCFDKVLPDSDDINNELCVCLASFPALLRACYVRDRFSSVTWIQKLQIGGRQSFLEGANLHVGVVIFFFPYNPPSRPANPLVPPAPESSQNVQFDRFRSFSVRFGPIRSVSGSSWRVLVCRVGSGWGRGDGAL